MKVDVSNKRVARVSLESSAPISTVAANANYFAACCGYNYFDKGLQYRHKTNYPFNELLIRKLSPQKKK